MHVPGRVRVRAVQLRVLHDLRQHDEDRAPVALDAVVVRVGLVPQPRQVLRLLAVALDVSVLEDVLVVVDGRLDRVAQLGDGVDGLGERRVLDLFVRVGDRHVHAPQRPRLVVVVRLAPPGRHAEQGAEGRQLFVLLRHLGAHDPELERVERVGRPRKIGERVLVFVIAAITIATAVIATNAVVFCDLLFVQEQAQQGKEKDEHDVILHEGAYSDRCVPGRPHIAERLLC